MKKSAALPLLIFILHILILLFLSFTVWPEMLAYPYLLNHGYSFYGDIIHPFMPLLPYFLAFFSRLPVSMITTLKIITLLSIALSDIFLWSMARKLFSQAYALVALALYAFWQIFFEGYGLWFDLVMTPVLLSLFILLDSWIQDKKAKNLLLSGILFSVAFFLKQSVIWLIMLLVFFYLFFGKKEILKDWKIFLLGLSLPTLLMVILLMANNSLTDFTYWTIIYPFSILPKMPGYIELPTLKNIFRLTFIFSPVFGLFFIPKKLRHNSSILLSLIFFVGCLFFSIHRFGYFHFQPALPYLALLSVQVFKLIKNKNIALFFLLYLLGSLYLQLKFLRQNWQKEDRFVESQVQRQVAEIKKIVPSQSRIFMLNVPAQYFVLADLLPLKPWADTFPWYLELPNMQETIANNLEKNPPRYVLFAPYQDGGYFGLGSYKPVLINRYIYKNYVKRFAVDSSLWLLEKK